MSVGPRVCTPARIGPTVLGLLAACGSAREPAPLDLRAYVPQTVGDRARFRGDDGHLSHVGITATTPDGLLVWHGTDRTAPTFLRVRAAAVDVVAPDGTVVMPYLRPPTAAEPLAYRLPDASACTLAVRSTDAQVAATGTRIEGCLETTRRCTLEPGAGLPRRTHTDEREVHCPSVGVVERSFRADPPLPFDGVRSVSHERLEVAHVRGGPRPAAGLALAARLVVMPSDVASACGATPVSTTLGGGPMLAEFTLPDGPLRLVVAPLSPADPLVVPDGRGAAVRIEAPPSCAAGAARLVPLVRSML